MQLAWEARIQVVDDLLWIRVAGEDTLEEEVRALRRTSTRGRRLWLGTIVGNIGVFLLLVAFPYFRGQHRAYEGQRALARFAACLVGGEERSGEGIALPDGARESYALRFWNESDWPAICAPNLDQVVGEEIFFVMPDVRHAENETRRAVELVREELEAAQGADRQGPVPERPWLALQRLMAALTLRAEAAQTDGSLFESMLTLNERAIRPELLPTRSAESAVLRIRPRASGIEALAIDHRGVSWVRVANGGVDGRRFRRPRILREALFVDDAPALLWATDPARCAGTCETRTSALSFLTDEDAETPEPSYLAAHPAAVGERVIRRSGGILSILAAEADGISLRNFAQDAPAPEEGPRRGEIVRRYEDVEQPYLLADGRVAGLRDERAVVFDDSELESISGRTWLEGAGHALFTGGSEVMRFHNNGWRPTGFRAELNERRVVARGEVAVLVGRGEDQVLHTLRCAQVCEVHRFEGVGRFDATLLDDGTLVVAYEHDGQIHALRIDGEGVQRSRPAPCFSESDIMCGAPTLGSDGERIVLAARHERDMWVVESRDGLNWSPMVGLR